MSDRIRYTRCSVKRHEFPNCIPNYCQDHMHNCIFCHSIKHRSNLFYLFAPWRPNQFLYVILQRKPSSRNYLITLFQQLSSLSFMLTHSVPVARMLVRRGLVPSDSSRRRYLADDAKKSISEHLFLWYTDTLIATSTCAWTFLHFLNSRFVSHEIATVVISQFCGDDSRRGKNGGNGSNGRGW